MIKTQHGFVASTGVLPASSGVQPAPAIRFPMPEPAQKADADALSFMEQWRCPVGVLDSTGRIVRLNRAWHAFAGVAGAERFPGQWSQLLHPEDRYEAFSQLRAATTTNDAAAFECRLISHSEPARWFLVSLYPLAGEEDGSLCLCTCADIHAIKRREGELQRRASIQTDMLNISADCIKLIALDGTLVHMNQAGCRALGLPLDSNFGMAWLPLLPEDVWEAGARALESARQGNFSRFPGRSVIAGRKPQYWDNMLTPVMDATGRPTAILCVSREVTAEQEALRSLKESEQRLAIAARVGGLGVWDYDIRNDLMHCDTSWYRIMGQDPDNPITSIREAILLLHPDDVDVATEVLRSTEDPAGARNDYESVFRIIRPSGETRWLRWAAHVQYEDGAPLRAVGFAKDITDAWRGELALRDTNRLLEAEKSSLARQCLEDPLTGLANRRFLDSELAHVCLRTSESGAALCVGMIDVDYFKAFNDRYGHLQGDAALKSIAAALQSAARQSDFVARYGGEEFAFIVAGTADPEAVLWRFTQAVEELAIAHVDSPTGYLTISCGCVVAGSPGTRVPAQLMQASDEALYEAKQAGRNCCVIRTAERP